MINNKVIGTAFEQEMCQILKNSGFWVHFIHPDNRGAQPFDIIAAKNGEAYAIDCKTCKDGMLNFTRLEDNQILAFNHWMKCGNKVPIIAVKYDGAVFMIPYTELKRLKKVKLPDERFLVSVE